MVLSRRLARPAQSADKHCTDMSEGCHVDVGRVACSLYVSLTQPILAAGCHPSAPQVNGSDIPAYTVEVCRPDRYLTGA